MSHIQQTSRPLALSALGHRRVLQYLQEGSAVAIAIVLVAAFTALRSDTFLTSANLVNVLSQVSVRGTLAIGMSIVMIAGGIDLSIGSLVSLAGVAGGSWLADGGQFWFVLPATIALGVTVGAISGVAIARSRVQPFILTLGGLSVFQGLALLHVHGQQIALFLPPGAFNDLGSGRWLGIPISGWIMIGLLAAAWAGMRYTRVGRNLYAIGGNETAAYLAGIRVDVYKVATYALMGALSGLAALILASKVAAAEPTMGAGLELQAIAAVVIGGVALTGGRGTVVGGMLGVVLLGVIQNSLNLLSIDAAYQSIVVGLIIVIAVVGSRDQRSARA